MTNESAVDPPSTDPAIQDAWRQMLTVETAIAWKRRVRNRIPSNPRCKMCAAPFSGPGGRVMSLIGHGPWSKNPKYCTACFATLRANHGGAEIECSLLFAVRRLLVATGHERPEGPWLPVGVGVNTDVAFVGSVGQGLDAELTAMGDAVNTTARLSSRAAAGEVLIPVEAAAKAHLPTDGLERRSLELKGKARPTDVLVLRLSAPEARGGP